METPLMWPVFATSVFIVNKTAINWLGFISDTNHAFCTPSHYMTSADINSYFGFNFDFNPKTVQRCVFSSSETICRDELTLCFRLQLLLSKMYECLCTFSLDWMYWTTHFFIIVAKFLSRPHLNLYGGEWIISCAVLQVDFSKPEQSPIEK